MRRNFMAVLTLCLAVLLACSACGGMAEKPAPAPESVSTEPEPSSASEQISEPEPTPEPEPEPESMPEPDRSAEYIYGLNPEFTPVDYGSPALLPPSEDAGEGYQDSLVFLCDSPTYWMGPMGLVDMAQIWTGPEGTMTLAYQSEYSILDPYDQEQRPIREVAELHQPKRMVIALGINGIMFMDEEYFKTEYMELVTDIKTLCPKTDVILQSIYPITPAYKNWGAITNVMITEANSWIMSIAEETGCAYLDSFSVLIGEDGYAKPELMQADGLHPNKDGLTLVLDYIRTHAHVTEE